MIQKLKIQGGIDMKTIKDKQILVGADFAGYPLKEAVVALSLIHILTLHAKYLQVRRLVLL